MNDNFRKQQKKYYCDIKRYLSGKPDAKHYFCSLKNNMETFIAEHSISDIAELYTQFGTPLEIADAYLGETSCLSLSRRVRKLKTFRIMACILVFLMVTFFFCFLHVLRERPLAETEIRIERRTE